MFAEVHMLLKNFSGGMPPSSHRRLFRQIAIAAC
jgi:hypothetical protein